MRCEERALITFKRFCSLKKVRLKKAMRELLVYHVLKSQTEENVEELSLVIVDSVNSA